MDRERKRFGLYMIVGAYLIYLAYQMYQNPDGGQRSMFINVFMGLFFVIGIGLLIFGSWLLYQNMKHPQEKNEAEDETEKSKTDEAEDETAESKTDEAEDEMAESSADGIEKASEKDNV